MVNRNYTITYKYIGKADEVDKVKTLWQIETEKIKSTFHVNSISVTVPEEREVERGNRTVTFSVEVDENAKDPRKSAEGVMNILPPLVDRLIRDGKVQLALPPHK